MPESLTASPSLAHANQTPDIVGIGASAGGLEALEQFFHAVTLGNNIAFIVIQHLNPTQPCMLPELLQRFTAMKVTLISDNIEIKPDSVYVIPPNKDLSILQGRLRLVDPIAPRGLRLPIDIFFKALADDQKHRSIGIILSGMGSDGTLGLRAIKEKAGLADKVAAPKDLWLELKQHLKSSSSGRPLPSHTILSDKSISALEKIILLLRDRNGHDFSMYKKNTLNRLVDRRMVLHQISNIGNYVQYLRNNPEELDLLFKELLIGVTQFFRDPPVWEQLKSNIVSTLFSQYPAGRAMRAWVPACSTGEEAYSLAILFKEALSESNLEQHFSLQIFATDLVQDAVQSARKAFYPATIKDHISKERLSRYFAAENKGYRVSNDIREMIIFAQQNIISDPPFNKLDLLICRNLLIYFNPNLQKKTAPPISLCAC